MFQYQTIDIAIISAFIILIILSVIMILKKDLMVMFTKIKAHRQLDKLAIQKKGYNTLDMHLNQVISATTSDKLSVNYFKVISMILFLFPFAFMSMNFNLGTSFIISLSLMLIPYFVLRMKLEKTRKEGSHEGEDLIIELLSKYRINNNNISESLEAVLEEKNQFKHTRRILFRLLIDLRHAKNNEMIQYAAERFAYSIGTNWSKALSKNIEIAAITGVNITNSLEDILIQLREARTIAEERKRLNSEAVKMARYLAPIIYIATVLMSIKYLDITPMRFIKNQIYSSEGALCFFLIIILFFVNLIIVEITNNKQFDY